MCGREYTSDECKRHVERTLKTRYQMRFLVATNFLFCFCYNCFFLCLSSIDVASATVEIDSRVIQKCGGCLNAFRKIRRAYQLEKQFTDFNTGSNSFRVCTAHAHSRSSDMWPVECVGCNKITTTISKQ